VKVHSIAIIGSRGIPATYGGFETLVEGIAPSLAEAGWEVFVSCEGGNCLDKPTKYKGVNLFYFPIRPFFRIIYEPLYDIYSLIRSSFLCSCIYMLGYGAGLFFFIPKIFHKPLVVNVDGIEWTRAKFNRLEKLILRVSEISAVKFASAIVADSNEISGYIESKYNKKAIYITNGVNIPQIENWDQQKIDEQGFLKHGSKLQAGDYWLVVARLEPENNIHVIIQSFLLSGSKRKLVIVGDFSRKGYQKHIIEVTRDNRARERVILTGAVYNMSLLNMLRQNCFAYIHGHSAGGTNPSLLEAMSMKSLIISHDNRFNREVGEETMLYFIDENDLTTKMVQVENNPDAFAHLKEAAYSRVISNYLWNDIIERYDNLFKETVSGRTRR